MSRDCPRRVPGGGGAGGRGGGHAGAWEGCGGGHENPSREHENHLATVNSEVGVAGEYQEEATA
jgi:hypothetical protein